MLVLSVAASVLAQNAVAPSHQQYKWAKVVQPWQQPVRFSARDKLLFALRDEVRPVSLVPTFFSAGLGHALDSDPKYGTDSAGFGERLGGAALRQASMRILSYGVLPAVTREDPRYYRLGADPVIHGGRYAARSLYALERVLVARRDSGAAAFNTSNVVGHLAASLLVLTYYPHVSANTGVVMRTWGISLAGNAGNNLMLEFLPDLLKAVHHRKPGEVVGEPLSHTH